MIDLENIVTKRRAINAHDASSGQIVHIHRTTETHYLDVIFKFQVVFLSYQPASNQKKLSDR